MLLNRDDWYETSRELDWTLSYVAPEDAFPTSWSGTEGVPTEAWEKWEEPFRVSYRDYVRPHRMGWRMRPTLLRLGPVTSAAAARLAADPPLGPILGVATYDEPGELHAVVDRNRADFGVAWVHGAWANEMGHLPHGVVERDPLTGDFAADIRLAPAWFRGQR